MGFTFDDTDTKGLASPLAEMNRLIAKDPRNAERIFPYIGGEEVNDSPTHAPRRYVINFEDFPVRRKETGHSWFALTEETQRAQLQEGIVAPDYPGSVASDWPDLLAIIEQRVRPGRAGDKREHYRDRWWQYAENRPGLRRATKNLPKCIVLSRIGQALAFTSLPSGIVANEKTVVLPFSDYSHFAVLQSRIHESWARFFSTTLKDDLSYTPSLTIDPFVFPESLTELEFAGRAYYDFRAALMARNNEGLTKTYNRFNDPGDISDEIVQLRRLHDAMDRAVLDAYSWADLQPDCCFIPEFDDDDEEESTRKKKRFRYRWPDEVRDDVLARLLILNQQRYEEEVLEGLHDSADGSRGIRRKSVPVDEEWTEDQGELEL